MADIMGTATKFICTQPLAKQVLTRKLSYQPACLPACPLTLGGALRRWGCLSHVLETRIEPLESGCPRGVGCGLWKNAAAVSRCTIANPMRLSLSSHPPKSWRSATREASTIWEAGCNRAHVLCFLVFGYNYYYVVSIPNFIDVFRWTEISGRNLFRSKDQPGSCANHRAPRRKLQSLRQTSNDCLK